MKPIAIDFNQSSYNSHIEDIGRAEALLLKLVDEFEQLTGNEPEDLQEFLKDPYVFTGELITQGIKVEGMELSLEKRLFLKDVDLSQLHKTYEELTLKVKEAELTLHDFDNNYKIKDSVLSDIKETYTVFAETKAEQSFYKRLDALVRAYNDVHAHLKGKGLTPNVNGFVIARNDLTGVKVNTQAFKLISRTLNRT